MAKAWTIVYWNITALFCLQMSFTAYAQLCLPQVAQAFAVEEWARQKGLPQGVDETKAALCRGYSWQSVQAALIKKHHQDFFKWLECEKYPERGPR